MPSLLLHIFTCVSVFTAMAAVTTESVVGVAGRRVTLPCRSEAARQNGVEVCWGRGEPSLFNCHNTVVNAAGDHVTYRKSYRYSVSSPSSLSIFASRPADSGFYHCRVQLPGLFNDQTSTVLLIIVTPRSVNRDAENLNTSHATTTSRGTPAGSDVTGDSRTGPVVAQLQRSVQQQPVNTLQSFIGNTVRGSFITFIPAVLMATAYGYWRNNQRLESDSRPSQSEEEDSAV